MFWKRKPPPTVTPDQARLNRLEAFLPHIYKLGYEGSPEGQWGIHELRQEVRFAIACARRAETKEGA